MSRATAIDSTDPPELTERIKVLDVLRGIALLGMLVSHFDKYGIRVSGINNIIGRGVGMLIHDRFYTIFAILFGAGFALQLRRNKFKNERFVPIYLRRIFALACFGFIKEVVTGANILFDYAICGLLLLPIRNWSTKALIILLFLCIILNPFYRIVVNSADAVLYGAEQAKQNNNQHDAKVSTALIEHEKRDSLSMHATSYRTALKVQTEDFIQHYSKPVIDQLIRLLSETFMLFLIGFIALRMKLFEKPDKHRRLIVTLMVSGAIFFILNKWALPFFSYTPEVQYPNISFPAEIALFHVSKGFGLVRDNWLSFTYIGTVLLLVSYNPDKWLKYLSLFGWTGRMALTNYMFQGLVISILFAKYGLGLPKFPEIVVVIVVVLLLYGAMVLFGRWWLTRYKYGPLEWVWRCVTYLKSNH